jgi:phosphoglucomutase/phosphomannomutase
MELLSPVVAGFQAVDADPALKTKALAALETWLTQPDYGAYRPQLDWLIGQRKFAELLDAFYQVLPFGTGGRRGAVGIGPNRMNLWTLGASVQGHSDYLKQKFPGVSPLRVALAYDVREFKDKRGVYNPALPNPVLGLSSRDFAQYAAGVYIANGIHAHILPADSSRYLATPELSFAIRALQCHGGLNVSASHNPPDDNGGKFYDERGGQPVPPDDQLMSDYVDQVVQIKHLPWAETVRSGKLHYLDEALHVGYIDLCKKQSLLPPPRFDEIGIVFTPLHGVGAMTAMEVLTAQGFRPIPVEAQMTPNGQFPNVTKSPNPEVPESMDQAEALAKQHQADLALATDPDADRIGALARAADGSYRFIMGNEISALVTYFKLHQLAAQNRLPASPLVIKTEVTTTLVTRIARSFGAQVVDDLLVGFKYMADVLYQLESTGTYEDIKGTPADFIIATEESHGVMAMAQLRDKDAAAAALLLAELALQQKRAGSTIPALLTELAQRFGYFRNETLNIVMSGIEGKSNMTRMLDRLRAAPPAEIAGLAVTQFEDLRDETGRMGPLKGATDAASRNGLIFRLGDARTVTDRITARVVLRPSGTEPKAKAYIEACTGPCPPHLPADEWANQCRAVDALTQKLATDFLTRALATVGITPAPGADKLSR